MTKKKKLIIVLGIVIAIALTYVCIWLLFYQFVCRPHITDNLTLNDTGIYKYGYFNAYEVKDNSDNYMLSVPKFLSFKFYGGMASGQFIDEDDTVSNPSGLDFDIVQLFDFNLIGNVKQYRFSITALKSQNGYKQNNNYLFILDRNGNLLNESELNSSGMSLYNDSVEDLQKIIEKEKEFFKIS